MKSGMLIALGCCALLGACIAPLPAAPEAGETQFWGRSGGDLSGVTPDLAGCRILARNGVGAATSADLVSRARLAGPVNSLPYYIAARQQDDVARADLIDCMIAKGYTARYP